MRMPALYRMSPVLPTFFGPGSVQPRLREGRVSAMILYLDCANGVSGDMLVAALLAVSGARPDDPGPLDDVVRPALAAAGIDPRLVAIEEVRRGGFTALSFRVSDGPGFATFDELIMSMYASDLEQPVADAVASVAERMAAAGADAAFGGHGPGDHVLLETSIDDLSPELVGHAADVLREAGAVDVWMSQAFMKKGRPGVRGIG